MHVKMHVAYKTLPRFMLVDALTTKRIPYYFILWVNNQNMNNSLLFKKKTILTGDVANSKRHLWLSFIHSNFLFSDWFFIVNMRRVILKMYNALRVLRPGCVWYFWCMIACVLITSTDSFFHLVRLLTFFMFSGILKPSYFF